MRKIQEKQEKIQRVMKVIYDNWLDKDKEFMEDIEELIQALKEEK
jgi:protein tyrosine phosphatase